MKGILYAPLKWVKDKFKKVDKDVTDISSNLSTLQNAPHVVNSGESGIWHYKEWSNGEVEIYGNYSQGTIAVTTAYGNFFISSLLSVQLPSDVPLSEIISANCTLNSTGAGSINLASTTPTILKYYVMNGTSTNLKPIIHWCIRGIKAQPT